MFVLSEVKTQSTRILEYIFKQTNKSKIRSVKTLKTKIFCIGWFSKIILKSIIKNVKKFRWKTNMSKFSRWDYKCRKNRIWCWIWEKKVSSRGSKGIFFRIKPLFMVNYNICATWNTLQTWCAELTDFTALQTFKERTLFNLTKIGFAKEDTSNLQKRIYLHSHAGSHENKMMIRFCWNIKEKIRRNWIR